MTPSTTTSLQEARARIDEINERVVELLAERQAIVDELCDVKADTGQAIRDPDREAELLAHVRSVAEEEGLPPDLATTLFEVILEHSVQRQRRKRQDEHVSTTNGQTTEDECSETRGPTDACR